MNFVSIEHRMLSRNETIFWQANYKETERNSVNTDNDNLPKSTLTDLKILTD